MINAGGHIEKKPESDEDLELDGSKDGENDATGSVTSFDSEESSSGATSDDIMIDSAVPLMSEEEEGEDIEDRQDTDSIEKELSRRHKLRLLVSKGSMIVVSCAVLLVGVVLAAILHHDYSSCEFEEMEASLSVVVSSTAAVYSTGSITRTPGPIPTTT